MNILVFTNTYMPHVGGVARSVHGFVEEFRRRGHVVRVVAPRYSREIYGVEGISAVDEGVFRVPAVENFNASGFSVPLVALGKMPSVFRAFTPDIVHAHHPYLLGNTALRVAAYFDAPAVFTHHTLYERYTHYIPGDSPFLKHFAIRLTTAFCNLCSAVVAPSRSVVQLLARRGVRTPIEVIPTGIDTHLFSHGDRASFRRRAGIPGHAFVVGHVGRLSREKNLEHLTLVLCHFLKNHANAHVIIAGIGPMEEYLQRIFYYHGIQDRLHLMGLLDNNELPDAYHAMDVFAFSSQSETQGLVLMEAMASGLPVVALDGPGVRDVVKDGVNGRLVHKIDIDEFVRGLCWVGSLDRDQARSLSGAARKTAEEFTPARSAGMALALYKSLIERRSHMVRHGTGIMYAARAEARIAEGLASSFIDSLIPDRDDSTCMEALQPIPRTTGLRARLLGTAISLVLRFEKASWQKKGHDIGYLREEIEKGEPLLVCFWHGGYLPLFALLEGLKGCIFASCSFRGDVIAEVCRRFGYKCIQIPAHSKERSIEIMADSILRFRAGALAADGPRGPSGVFRLGAVELASKLGMKVIPAAAAVYPRIVMSRRWDRREVPLPFGSVFLFIGNRIDVPPGLRQDELGPWSTRLKEALDIAGTTARLGLDQMRGLKTTGQTHIGHSQAGVYRSALPLRQKDKQGIRHG